MPTAQEFFDLTDAFHSEIFQAEEDVWTALNRLPDFLASLFRGSWPLSETAGLIQRPLAIHRGRCIEGVAAKPGGSENTFTVSFEGKVLEGAALDTKHLVHGVIEEAAKSLVESSAYCGWAHAFYV